MKIRLGYVSSAVTLNHVTASSMMTYTHFKSLDTDEAYQKLDKITKSNLEALIEILKYNIANNIHFYRLTATLIPLNTHRLVNSFNLDKYKPYFEVISLLVNQSKMRIDLHTSAFSVLNSVKSEVVEQTKEDLKKQYDILRYMGVNHPRIILHIGSSALGKKSSLKRFVDHFNSLDSHIRQSIMLENDDKVYNAYNTLKLCQALSIPMVLDVHHHQCNHNYMKLSTYLKDILSTWDQTNDPPKIHFSTPKGKTKQDVRSHHDYIDSDAFIAFIKILKLIDRDVDIMLEAKMKDMALFKLIRELKYKADYLFIDDTTFIV